MQNHYTENIFQYGQNTVSSVMEETHYNQPALADALRHSTIWLIIGLCCWQIILRRHIIARSALVRENLFCSIISNLALIATILMSPFSKP